MISKILLVLRTISYLKPKQILFRFFYLFRSKLRRLVRFKYKYNLYRKGKALNFTQPIANSSSYNNNKFYFLNRTVFFSNEIDWGYLENGMLWAYNINYFDYLNQYEITKEEGEELILKFIDKLPTLSVANDPYPISLRGINWVKFLSKHSISKKSIDTSLYSQYRILLDKLEFHILGNHLLENAFSLMFGAYYFNGTELYKKGKEILIKELNEQVLADGAHYELAPMYHKIMLCRLLDVLNLIQNNKDVYYEKEFHQFLIEKSKVMLSWLEEVTFVNGTTPRVNDSTEYIAPESHEIFQYAKRLGIAWEKTQLNESGYRMYKKGNYELFVDYAQIGPDYIPGHAHADTFSFLLNIGGKPILVDPGISTYEAGRRRQVERSTSYHNTVVYAKDNQSEVWGGFRVGRRAYAKIKEETNNSILGYHNGYKRNGVYHYRRFDVEENGFKIKDYIICDIENIAPSVAYFHFHPNCIVELGLNEVKADNITLSFEHNENIKLQTYNYAHGYNFLDKAKVVAVSFQETLITNVKVE